MASMDDTELISLYQTYRQESTQAKSKRMALNKINFAAYHMEQDFSGKKPGQSAEFLPKLAMAVEQGSSFMQQGLIDMGDWFKAEPSPGLSEDAMRVKPSEIQRILARQLGLDNFMECVGDATKLGFLGSLIIAKVGGRWVTKPRYVAETYARNGAIKKKLVRKEDKRWQLKIDLVRQEDYNKDPTGQDLYETQDIYLDYYQVEALAKGPNAIYELERVQTNLRGMGYSSSDMGSDAKNSKNRETGMSPTSNGRRHLIKLTEVWGNFLNAQGELVYENHKMTIANDTWVIERPCPNPIWHQESPYVTVPLLSVPGSVWGKTPMDAAASLNFALNEMFNLMLDGGMMSVHGIKQIRRNWLADESQVTDGISAGDSLEVSSSCPPGQKVLETVATGDVPQEGMVIYNLLNQEFVTAAMTNDLRMGVQPFRQVKATEIVESSQAITSMFTGLAKRIEAKWIQKLLAKAWATCAQHMDDLDSDELISLLGKQRAEELARMGPEELFAETVQGCKFKVFGISESIAKKQDLQAYQMLLQTLAAAPPLMEAFMKQGGDMGKLLVEMIKGMGLSWYKIQSDEAQGLGGQPPPLGEVLGGQVQGELPNDQSQIQQPGSDATSADPAAQAAQPGAIAGPNFPPSRATPSGGF